MERKDKQTPIRIALTEEQREKLRQVTGKQIKELEFSAMELEERIAPAMSRN